MNDDAHRGPRRDRQAHALSPPSGAVGEQQNPQGDEPQSHAPKHIWRYSKRFAWLDRISPSRATSSSAFPGETEEDFEATLQIVDAVRYASAYSFKYSARPGTPAATMEDQIPREIMDDRLQRLQARINAHQLAFNRSKVGVETQVLIERNGKHDGQMIGRSPWLQSVHVESDAPARRHRRCHARRRGPEQHDRRHAAEGRRLMARRELQAVAGPRPPRNRVRPALSSGSAVRRLRPAPDHHRAAARRPHLGARQSRSDRGRCRRGVARSRCAYRPLQSARPGPRCRCRSG